MFFVQIILFAALLAAVEAFNQMGTYIRYPSKIYMMADVELTFPNKKKVKVPSGSPLAAAAKKAGYTPNYGCEEGKCGSCELKVNGKTKIRPCIGKVRNLL